MLCYGPVTAGNNRNVPDSYHAVLPPPSSLLPPTTCPRSLRKYLADLISLMSPCSAEQNKQTITE